MPRFVPPESHPRISISILRHLDLLDDDRETVVKVSLKLVTFVLLRFSTQYILAVFRQEGKTIVQRITIGTRVIAAGRRQYLQCPVNGSLCNELHFINGHFASRKAHSAVLASRPSAFQRSVYRQIRIRDRLLGHDGRGPARGQNRAKLIRKVRSEVERLGFVPEAWRALTALMIDSDRKNLRAECHVQKSFLYLNSDAGFLYGETIDAETCTKLASITTFTEARPASFGPDRPLRSVEQHASLTIKDLREAWGTARNQLQGHRMGWRPESIGGATVEIVGNLRPDDPSGLIIYIISGGERAYRQAVRIMRPRKPSGRIYFECPVTHAGCETLYLRDGLFASRFVQRLIYPSQRKEFAPIAV